MSTNWDIYKKRINTEGSSHRERQINRAKDNISKHVTHNPSYKTVLLNGKETGLIIATGTRTYYKEFQSLPGETILCGDYVQWKNRTWLVYEADVDDEVYIDGKMYECNYVLYWQNKDGIIIKRPAFILNASAYNNGESGNNTITLASNQFMVYMPIDEETLKIRNNKRIFIDNYQESPFVYSLTRPDNISMAFGGKGITYYIFTQTGTSKDNDKQVTLDDGTKVWIADYFSPTVSPETDTEIPYETTVLCQIQGSKTLKIGYSKTYSVSFTNEDGNELSDVEFEWNVVSDFDVRQTVDGQTIKLLVDDEDSIGSSFLLSIIVSGIVVDEIEIFVISEI